jgi:hypothetical protein
VLIGSCRRMKGMHCSLGILVGKTCWKLVSSFVSLESNERVKCCILYVTVGFRGDVGPIVGIPCSAFGCGA